MTPRAGVFRRALRWLGDRIVDLDDWLHDHPVSSRLRAWLTTLAWLFAAGFGAHATALALPLYVPYVASLTRSLNTNGRYWRAPQDPRDPAPQSRALALALALTGGGARPFRADPRVVHDDLPILAVKRVRAEAFFNALLVSGVAHAPLEIDGEAECRGWLDFIDHPAPQWDCTCGFYAVPADRLHEWPFGGLIAEVELSGVVIEHESGYRAQYQRVVGLYDDGGSTLAPERRRAIEDAYGMKIQPSPWETPCDHD